MAAVLAPHSPSVQEKYKDQHPRDLNQKQGILSALPDRTTRSRKERRQVLPASAASLDTTSLRSRKLPPQVEGHGATTILFPIENNYLQQDPAARRAHIPVLHPADRLILRQYHLTDDAILLCSWPPGLLALPDGHAQNSRSLRKRVQGHTDWNNFRR